jgi:hypothetical protein
MALYIRDERVSNTSVNLETLKQLNDLFIERARAANDAYSRSTATPDVSKLAYVSFIIRFDNKGYRIYSFDDLVKYFNLATEVERVIFMLETPESQGTNRTKGTSIDLRFDQKDANTCWLQVNGDDKDWVDSSFNAIQDVLNKYKNRNGWARTQLVHFMMQLVGLVLGFTLSLWAAIKGAPKLTLENAFLFVFFFVFLLFANTWNYAKQAMYWVLNSAFPNIKFIRPEKDHLHWLYQAVVGSIVFAIMAYALDQAFGFFIETLNSFIHK